MKDPTKMIEQRPEGATHKPVASDEETKLIKGKQPFRCQIECGDDLLEIE